MQASLSGELGSKQKGLFIRQNRAKCHKSHALKNKREIKTRVIDPWKRDKRAFTTLVPISQMRKLRPRENNSPVPGPASLENWVKIQSNFNSEKVDQIQ